MVKKAIVTGSSGLLGRQVVKLFAEKNWVTIGVCYSRGEENNLHRKKVDLRDEDAVKQLISSEKPDVIVHWYFSLYVTTAQQFETLKSAKRINKKPLNSMSSESFSYSSLPSVTEQLGRIAAENGAWMIFISTDYVFDGTQPPYATNAETNPLNFYGKTKRDAEKALWRSLSDAGILRVPVLYGAVESLEESAITVLAKHLFDTSPVTVDDVQKRYPTHVNDVATVCWQLAERKLIHCGLYGTWHWSSKEQFTKYSILKEMANILGVSIDHVTPSSTLDPSKPKDAHLNCIALDVMGIGTRTSFREGISPILQQWKQ